jgi:hypothetical protein
VAKTGIGSVLLSSTPRRWRFTVLEDPDAVACGDLPDLPASAPFEVAEARFREVLLEAYGVTVRPTWQESKPGWWGAEVLIPPLGSVS